jgi:hypothetical protein
LTKKGERNGGEKKKEKTLQEYRVSSLQFLAVFFLFLIFFFLSVHLSLWMGVVFAF